MKVGILATTIILIGFPLAALAGLAPDGDNDGIPDVNDNCSALANAAPLNCDTDNDGYGNLCDTDFDNDHDTDGTDFNPGFFPDFKANNDSGTGTDIDCDGDVDGTDFNPGFFPKFKAFTPPGPSGLGCAGTVPCP